MSLPYVKRQVSVASGGTASTPLLIDDSICTVPLILCAVKLNTALTAVTAHIEMSSDGVTYSAIQDETKTAITFDLESAIFSRLKPTDYAVFEKYIRVGFGSAVSADATLDLYFRPC